jgi:hypothetical protein
LRAEKYRCASLIVQARSQELANPNDLHEVDPPMSTSRANVLDRTVERADVVDKRLAEEPAALSTRATWPWSMSDHGG